MWAYLFDINGVKAFVSDLAASFINFYIKHTGDSQPCFSSLIVDICMF